MSPENLYIQPTLTGTMWESPDYQVLNVGLTDRIFLLGHADGLEMNDPYQVIDIREAVTKLGADSNSPLLRALLECYYSGARDIWLVAAAPMSEYKDPVDRDQAWYQAWAAHLTNTYNLLADWDIVQILVPLDAPYYDAMGVDFLLPLASHCNDAFALTGSIRIGLIGTQTGPLTDDNVMAMATDPRLDLVGDAGKFVAVVVGEGVLNTKELPTLYTCPLVTAAAAELCQLPKDRGMTYRNLSYISQLVTRPTSAHKEILTNAKLNPVALTSLGDRGGQYEAVILTDNTLGTTGTDYWSLAQVRLVMEVIEAVRTYGRRIPGAPSGVAFDAFKRDVQNYFLQLMAGNVVRDFTLNINRSTFDYKVLVDISIKPYFGLRQINFVTAVGPAA